jgi:acetylornithine deacetylase/succinyl-diaminopimelate desuccinylase-like protein
VSTEQIGQGQAFRADTTSPAYRAMAEAMAVAYPGQEMQYAGQGGSIPLCNTLASLYPKAEILLIGLSEPEAQIHAVNESVSPEELERLSVAEALFLRNYASGAN